MIQLKLIDTYWPLIIPAITTPVVVFIMYFLLSRYIVEGVSLEASRDEPYRISAFQMSKWITAKEPLIPVWE